MALVAGGGVRVQCGVVDWQLVQGTGGMHLLVIWLDHGVVALAG